MVFIGGEICAKANALLEVAGKQVIDNGVERWAPISTWLQESGVSCHRVNRLIAEVNQRFLDLKAADKREKQQWQVQPVRDIEGLPCQLDIWYNIPPDRLINLELQEAFPVVTPSNPAWHQLVKAVAYYESKAGCWLPLAQPSNHKAWSPAPLNIEA